MRTIFIFSFLFFPFFLFSTFDQNDLYYADVAAQAHKYSDPEYIDRTYFYACHGVSKNYLFSRDLFSRTCERVSRLSIPLFSYLPEHESLPRITVATDVLSLVRLAASLMSSISADDIRMAPLPERVAFEYRRWTSADFAQHFQDTVHFELGRSSADERLLIIHQYSLYRFPGFVAFVRTFPEFQQELSKIHRRLHHDKKFAAQVARMEEFTAQSFHAIVKQHRTHDKNQGKKSGAKPKAITLDVPLEQGHNHCSVGSNQLKQQYKAVVADDVQGFHADRIKNRLRALQAGVMEDWQPGLSDAAITLLQNLERDSAQFSSIHGTAIQQVLQQEFVGIVNQAACMHQELGLDILPLQENLIEFADVGVDYNRAGYVVQSATVADWCWAWLDCCKHAALYSVSHGCSPMFMTASIDVKYSWALVEGSAKGTFNVVSGCANIVYHPINFTVSFGTGLIDVVCYSGYCLAKVMSEAAYIDYHCHYGDPLKALDRANYLVNGGTVLSGCIAQKLQAIPSEDLVKEGTAIAVEAWITGKLLTSCLKFVTQVGKYAERAQLVIAKAVQAGESAAQAQGATTAEFLNVEVGHQAEMFLAEAAQQGGKRVGDICGALGRKIEKISYYMPEIDDLIPEMSKKFDNLRNGFGGLGPKKVTFAFEHILKPEIHLSFTKGGNMKCKFTGAHCNYDNLLENKNIVEFINVTRNSISGVQKVDMLWGGKIYRNKTLFPSEWPPEKIMLKIVEAYDDFVLHYAKGLAKPIFQENSKYRFLGKTSEGIIIEMIMDLNAQIETAYPVFV